MNTAINSPGSTYIAPKPCSSALSWPAIFAGAVTAAAISLILLILGSALGLSTISPWSQPDTATSLTAKAIIWLIVMQWVASGIGGYITGRLRTRWLDINPHEVMFRDTAHGFLAWAVSTLLTASVLTTTAASILGAGVQAGATISAGAAAAPAGTDPRPEMDANAYYIDGLFRGATAPVSADRETRGEVTRILLQGLKDGNVPDGDKAYLAHLVSNRTGVDDAEATRRVNETINGITTAKEKAKQDAEKARKLAMQVSVYVFLSLLVGAFIASVTAAMGGTRRDEI